MKAMAAIGAAILVAVAVVVIAVGAWQLDWFVREKNVNREGEVAQQSYSRQVGLVAGINNDAETIATIDVQITTVSAETQQALRAQRKVIVSSLCENAANLTGSVEPSSAAKALIAKEC